MLCAVEAGPCLIWAKVRKGVRMTLEEMKQRKKELGYTYARLSELSGVPLSTVQKIFGGATTAPRYDTMLALESLLVPAPSQTASASADTASHPG